jgi:hypothetical protein
MYPMSDMIWTQITLSSTFYSHNFDRAFFIDCPLSLDPGNGCGFPATTLLYPIIPDGINTKLATKAIYEKALSLYKFPILADTLYIPSRDPWEADSEVPYRSRAEQREAELRCSVDTGSANP